MKGILVFVCLTPRSQCIFKPFHLFQPDAILNLLNEWFHVSNTCLFSISMADSICLDLAVQISVTGIRNYGFPELTN